MSAEHDQDFRDWFALSNDRLREMAGLRDRRLLRAPDGSYTALVEHESPAARSAPGQAGIRQMFLFRKRVVMTISGRLAMLFKAKAPRVLDRAEDPRETLGYSYQKQLDLLQQVRRGVAEVATSRERLELQAEQLSASADTLQQQAAQAVSAGREDLARDALTRRSASLEQLTDLGRRHASLQAQEAKLTSSAQRLKSKVQAFRAREETIKATYTPAEAQIKMGEAFSGISEEMADVGLAMRRAEDKTTQLQARAGATDELIAPGSLDVASGPAQDPVQAERDQMSAHSHDQFELARLKAALPAGGTPVAISAGPHDCDTATPPQTEPAADPFHSAENQR